MTTLGKKQIKLVQEGVRNVSYRQRAENECVKGIAAPMTTTTMMMLICTSSLAMMARAWPDTVLHDIGGNARQEFSDGRIRGMVKMYEENKPSLVVSYLGKKTA